MDAIKCMRTLTQEASACSFLFLHGDADMFLSPCFPIALACPQMLFTLRSCPSSSHGDMSWVRCCCKPTAASLLS